MEILKFLFKIIKSLLPSTLKNFLRRFASHDTVKTPIPIKSQNQRRFFLSDDTFIHSPLSATATRVPQKIYWDRNDLSLKNHFYTHEKIFSDSQQRCNQKV